VTLGIVAFITLSACIHVGWNLILKQSQHRQLTSWLSICLAGFGTLPFVWSQTSWQLWAIACAGALFQAGYSLLLAYGYDHYDLGVLYPIARGVAPLLAAIWATIWLGDTLQLGGVLAILLITGGTIWIGVRQQQTQHGHWRIPWMPLLIALMISGYTIIDAFGTRQSTPLTYYSVCMTCTAMCMSPIVYWHQRGDFSRWWHELPKAAIIGSMSFVSYLIVLSCYAVAPVSYVAATREMSIVIAGLVGWLWLKESLGSTRLIGASIVCLGVITLVLIG
jgi:drug/metabolite transporter (DMT)-like permease